MAARSGKGYQRKALSSPDATRKETPQPKNKTKASSCAAEFEKLSTRSSRTSEKLKLERQLAIQKVELEFKERELQLQMEKLKMEKEMKKTKTLLDVVEESIGFESDEDEEKVKTMPILSEMPEDASNDNVERFFAAMPQSVTMAQEEEKKGTLRELVNSFRLPPIHVEKFKGDPLKYPVWLSTFDNLIASRASTPGEKLNLLSQHLERGATLHD
ncbi:hypothetical protein HOLleu_00588 [Holothuria leucospilota]|uniref:Uncharacterized protein n=1 Tax=Holothuria leucospilota TaxID=206669 RepID=A0A9Q1CMY8_HOLLE|nr:hypothetical protein HOLleu_00588 [Holothuria leucospilota]